MKSTKAKYLALYTNWEETNEEELWLWLETSHRVYERLKRFFGVLLFLLNLFLKLVFGLLLNTNYLVRHTSAETLPEEVNTIYSQNQNWFRI